MFALQQPDGGVYLFQAASQDQVNEWVGTCNYWAARQSKEPLPGGVSNMEYGWGACLDDIPDDLDSNNSFQQHYYSATASSTYEADALTIYEWRPPAPPLVSSTLDEREQYDALQKHLAALDEEINKHRELKEKMLIKVKILLSRVRILLPTNWLFGLYSFRAKVKTTSGQCPTGNPSQSICCMRLSSIRIIAMH